MVAPLADIYGDLKLFFTPCKVIFLGSLSDNQNFYQWYMALNLKFKSFSAASKPSYFR